MDFPIFSPPVLFLLIGVCIVAAYLPDRSRLSAGVPVLDDEPVRTV